MTERSLCHDLGGSDPRKPASKSFSASELMVIGGEYTITNLLTQHNPLH